MSTFELAAAVIGTGVVWLIYDASQSLDEKHWQLKMGLFYGSLAMGWAMLNFALALAVDEAVNTKIYASIENVYYAYSIISILAIIYLVIRFFWAVFQRGLSIAKNMAAKKNKLEIEDEKEW